MFKFLVFLLLGSSSATPYVGKVFIPESYSMLHRPVHNHSEVMNITIGIVITQILNIDFKTSALDFNIEFIVSWVDELIDIENGMDGNVHLENASSIWTPDLYIYNLIKYNIQNMDNSHFVLSKNGSYVNVIHFF